MQKKEIRIKDKLVIGYEINLPKANLVLVAAEKGFVCCGYLDLETAEKLGDAAAIVRGVKTVEDLLVAKIVGSTTAAGILGIKTGMSGKEALELMV
jgi:uncharacterized protein YunC (DUF1805 family)